MRTLGVIVLSVVALCGCGEQPATVAPVVEPPAATRQLFANAEVSNAVMGKWSRSCALCHVNGEGGAPRMGNAEEWRGRLAQGETTLLNHTIEGFNRMPPLGYCMSCEREDLRALIKLMSANSS